MLSRFKLPESFRADSICVGVTGGIGTGKSTLCKAFEQLGYPVIYADNLAKEIMNSNGDVKENILLHFGQEAYKNGSLHRVFLAEKVFSDNNLRVLLNSIVHPPVIAASIDLIRDYKQVSPLVFYEAALLSEAGMLQRFDVIAVVTAPLEKRMEWLRKKDGASSADIAARIYSQLSFEIESVNAYIEIENNGTAGELESTAEKVCSVLRGKLNYK